MTDYNLPDKDDAPWLDTTYDGFNEEQALKALDKLHKENEKGMKELAVDDGFKIQEQSFYDQLWELLETELGDTVLCDQMADRIYDLVKLYLVKEDNND